MKKFLKNWEKIFGINHHFVKIKKITLLGQTDSLNLEFKIDSSKSFEIHSKNPEIKLKCEEILGIKVNKILFFQDVLSKESLVNSVIKKNSSKKLKDVNNQQLNDIKDEEVRSIFKNISNKINE